MCKMTLKLLRIMAIFHIPSARPKTLLGCPRTSILRGSSTCCCTFDHLISCAHKLSCDLSPVALTCQINMNTSRCKGVQHLQRATIHTNPVACIAHNSALLGAHMTSQECGGMSHRRTSQAKPADPPLEADSLPHLQRLTSHCINQPS